MKVTAKQIKLISFFAALHLFLPFALVKCGGEDLPFVREAPGSNDEDDTVNCDSNEFLTKACADKLDEEAEQAADEAAADEAEPPAEPAEEPSEEDAAEPPAAPPATVLQQQPKIKLNPDFQITKQPVNFF